MIKNLNIVVAEDKNGKVKVVHVGKDRSKAKDAFEKATKSKENFLCVVHCRNPQFEARKFPSKAARYRAELAAEAKAEKEKKALDEAAAIEAAARLNTSFAALELADIHGIALTGIKGTGPNGQVITADVEPLIPAKNKVDPPADPNPSAPSSGSPDPENDDGPEAPDTGEEE